MKKCTKCNRPKDEVVWGSETGSYCKDCKTIYQREYFQRRKGRGLTDCERLYDKKHSMLKSAKKRAELNRIPYSLTVKDIIIPSHCPVLGIPLVMDNKKIKFNSPSLDRIVPELGYVPSNIAIISMRANVIKSDATHQEIRLVADWLEKQITLKT